MERKPNDQILLAKSYRDVVEWHLHQTDGQRRRGVNALAGALRCHATFIAKVLSGRAEFSVEQALAFCDHVALSEFERQFFLELLQLERAADQRTKTFFAARVDSLRQARLEVTRRLGSKEIPMSEVQSEYYGSWIPQFIHILCQTEGKHSTASIAASMNLPLPVVENTVRALIEGGIIASQNGFLSSQMDFVHLPDKSNLITQMHQQWRLKTAADMSRQIASKSFHFSALMSIDRQTVDKIKAILSESILNVKSDVATAKSQEIYFIGVDFYKPT